MQTSLPRPTSVRKISLTPLVDVVFLLLIFFMLTSQIAPFSLISLVASESATNQTAHKLKGIAEKTSKIGASLITISRGRIAVNGQRTPIGELLDVVNLQVADGTSVAILSARKNATVQDFTTVLEILKKSNLETVSIRRFK